MAGILAPWHWLTLAAIVGVIFHRRLPGFGRALGQRVGGFKRAWSERPLGPNLAREPEPKRYQPFVTASVRQDSRRPPGGILRLVLRSPRGRKLVYWSLLILGIAYVAATLTDGLFSSSSFRFKAIAFLVLFALGFVLLAVSWLFHRQKGKASRRLDG